MAHFLHFLVQNWVKLSWVNVSSLSSFMKVGDMTIHWAMFFSGCYKMTALHSTFILWTCLHLTKFQLKPFVLQEPDKTWALPGAANTVSVSTRCQMLATLPYKVSQSLCFKRVAGGCWTRNNKHLLLKGIFKTI